MTDAQDHWKNAGPVRKSPAMALADEWERAARTEPEGIRRSIATHAARYSRIAALERSR